jgi:hypothetical protein
MISKKFLNDLYVYKNGVLYYKKMLPKSTKRVGEKVGYLSKSGYMTTKIYQKSYLIHRLIFMMHHGFLPKYIDHADGNPLNNKIENLREATNSQNCKNGKLRKTNKSGYKNVHWEKLVKKWRVMITSNGKAKCFGFYENLNDAAKVAESVRKDLYGEFARNL